MARQSALTLGALMGIHRVLFIYLVAQNCYLLFPFMKVAIKNFYNYNYNYGHSAFHNGELTAGALTAGALTVGALTDGSLR